MPPGLTNYTFAFGETGTVLNTDDMSFPFIDVSSVTGLDTAPIRTSTTERHDTDGTYIDGKYMSMRTVVVAGTLYTDPTDPDTLLDSLRTDYGSSTIRPFYFQLPGKPLRFVNGQGGGLQYAIDTNRRLGITPVQFTVLAGDPYIYDYPGQSISAFLTSGAGIGMGFNFGFNLSFGGAIPVFGATINNAGTHTAFPTITLFGPLSNPVLNDVISGITMRFAISLNSSDALTINCKDKSVILNSQVSRRNTLQGVQWFSVAPGANTTINLSADSGTGTALVRLNNTYY